MLPRVKTLLFEREAHHRDRLERASSVTTYSLAGQLGYYFQFGGIMHDSNIRVYIFKPLNIENISSVDSS